MRCLVLLIFTAVLFVGCQKDTAPAESTLNDCKSLKEAISIDNLSQVGTIIDNYISKLPSGLHTEEDLNKLAVAISTECAIAVDIYCYNCIKTYPGQSEIIISFVWNGSTIKRTIDITGFPHEKMRFRYMHQ